MILQAILICIVLQDNKSTERTETITITIHNQEKTDDEYWDYEGETQEI